MIDSAKLSKIVDIDDLVTWPDEVVEFIETQSQIFDLGKDSYMSAGNRVLAGLFDSSFILVYHATRLLPHEIDDIRANGLKILTEELIEKKIREAVHYEYLPKEIGEELRDGSTFKTRAKEKRANQICVVLGKSAFVNKVSSLRPLFGIWGGETINKTIVGLKYRSILTEIGEPAVLKTLLPITGDSHLDEEFLLTLTFIRAFKNKAPVGSIHWKDRSIQGQYILDILKPADMTNQKA